MEHNELFKMLIENEQKLVRAPWRHSVEVLNQLLADEFIEFSSSGKIYTKAMMIEHLSQEYPIEFHLSNFEARLLSPDLTLMTYRGQKRVLDTGVVTESLRSSIWKKVGEQWQMVFHQGTPITAK